MTPNYCPIQRIAITPGEPAGIGPDQCILLSQRYLPCELVIVASPELMRQRALELGMPLEIKLFNPQQTPTLQAVGHIQVLPVELAAPVHCGQLNPANSPYVLETVRKAAQGCLDGTFAAMVTAPVHKGVINDAGFAFSGHTEFIAELTGGYPVMMMATEGLRVALATNHLPLTQVSAAITPDRLRSVLHVLEHDLRKYFNCEHPRILVCGLNPHAGESGHLGREEVEIITPVLDGLRDQGMDVVGPLPADSLFTPKFLESADVVLAMYHDQGLPVLKHKGFGNAVNVTLGLPIIRTSVDHGTALTIAGTGQADIGSLTVALQTALKMAPSQVIPT